MAKITFNFEQYDRQIANAGMVRLRKAAYFIAEETRKKYDLLNIEGARHIGGMIYRTSAFFHGPYKTGKYAGVYWTARTPFAMRHTIRVREKYGNPVGTMAASLNQDVRIYAGNSKTWWATQMEYGRGAWKGGQKSFFRPALHASRSGVQNIIENG